jgi:hypothetical protein
MPIPHGVASRFDHGAYDSTSGRASVAHTSVDGLAVLDNALGRYETTLSGSAET